ncbi:MAG: glycosyltransferase family 4 protein [Patescibacteria group bacterium]
MRRILIFSLVYYPRFIGGAEIAIKEITDRISPEEIEFDMITLRLNSALPRFEKIGNVNVYRVGWAGKQRVSSDSLPWYLHINKYALMATGFFRALSLSRIKKYDAVWSMMATYNSFAALFFKLTHPRIPFILTLQEGDPIPYIKHRALPLYPLFKMIFTHADHIQTISKYLANWAKDMGAKCPITVVPNAVDYELFSGGFHLEESEAVRKSLGKKDGDIFLITTSRLVVKNAVNDIIDSLQYLPDNVKLLILGQGYEEQNLKSQILNLRIQDRVQFLGFVPHNEMPKYLHMSDIFIRPSLSEGFGNSFIEAMAAGIPVIATPVGGIIDFLIDGETGLFCEVKNSRSIAQKVEKLIKDRESREYIIRNAKKMVEEKYGWGKIAGEMKEIFENAHTL